MVDVFNQEIVEKFTREIGYRLEEIEEDVAGQETIELKDFNCIQSLRPIDRSARHSNRRKRQHWLWLYHRPRCDDQLC